MTRFTVSSTEAFLDYLRDPRCSLTICCMHAQSHWRNDRFMTEESKFSELSTFLCHFTTGSFHAEWICGMIIYRILLLYPLYDPKFTRFHLNDISMISSMPMYAWDDTIVCTVHLPTMRCASCSPWMICHQNTQAFIIDNNGRIWFTRGELANYYMGGNIRDSCVKHMRQSVTIAREESRISDNDTN